MKAITTSKDRVKSRADRLHPIWWQGKQWAVTSAGIECRDGTYYIAKDRLDQERQGLNNTSTGMPDWILHTAAKDWVDIDDFATAFIVALVLHGYQQAFEPRAIREAVEKAKEQRKEAKAFSKRFEAHMIESGKWKPGDKFRCICASDLIYFE